MTTVDPSTVGYFYAPCHKCKAWIDFDREKPTVLPRSIPFTADEVKAMGFNMTVRRSRMNGER